MKGIFLINTAAHTAAARSPNKFLSHFSLAMLILAVAVSGCRERSSQNLSSTNDLSQIPLVQEGFTREDIFPAGTWPVAHGSTIVETSRDEFLACWFSGSKEAASDVEIFCSRNTAGQWAAPRVAVPTNDHKAVGNPSLFLDQQKVLWMFYENIPYVGGHSAALIGYRVSFDRGTSWSEAFTLHGYTPFHIGELPRSKPIPLDPRPGEARFLVPGYQENFKTSYVIDVRAKNGKILERTQHAIPGEKQIQPTLVRRDNTVHAWMRNVATGNIPHALFSLSSLTWTPVASINLPNPSSALDAIDSGSGDILLAYNHSLVDRSRLNLAVSPDGSNFTRIADLEQTTGGYGYPAMIRDSTGRYHITYSWNGQTIRHVTFDDKWLKRQKLSSRISDRRFR